MVLSINTMNYSNVLFNTIQKETCINTGPLLKYFLYQYDGLFMTQSLIKKRKLEEYKTDEYYAIKTT